MIDDTVSMLLYDVVDYEIEDYEIEDYWSCPNQQSAGLVSDLVWILLKWNPLFTKYCSNEGAI